MYVYMIFLSVIYIPFLAIVLLPVCGNVEVSHSSEFILSLFSLVLLTGKLESPIPV
jgi:hypothetical protein